MQRKNELITGEYYHVFNKSIAHFNIFNREEGYERMILSLKYYQIEELEHSLSQFLRLEQVIKVGTNNCISMLSDQNHKLVDVLAYCLMPTHIHLALKQLVDNGITMFMQKVLNSYALYFNKKYKRSGPLWTGRFKNVLVEDDAQLWHLTRYIHLNPTSAGLVEKPEDWLYSSYREYINIKNPVEHLLCQREVIDMSHSEYKTFTDDQTAYQRELSLIKHLALE